MNLSTKLLLKLEGELFKIISIFTFIASAFSLIVSFYTNMSLEYKQSITLLIMSYILYMVGDKLGEIKAPLEELENRRYVAISFIGLSWILIPIISTIPCLVEGYNFLDSLFNVYSSLTTSGVSTISPKSISLKFWLSYLQIVGSLGLLLYTLLILSKTTKWFPILSEMFKDIEMVSPKEMLKKVAVFYSLLLVISSIFFYFSGLDPLSSLLASFSYSTTGSYSIPRNPTESQMVIAIITMIISALGVIYVLGFRKKGVLKISLLFIAYIIVSGLIITKFTKRGFLESLYIETAASTTTGMATKEIPESALIILTINMAIGGLSGTFSGGIKFDRILIVIKYTKMRLLKSLNPKKITVEKIRNIEITDEIGINNIVIVLIYIISFWIFSTLFYLSGISSIQSQFLSVSFLSTTGFQVHEIELNTFQKVLSIIAMWLGRIDIIVGILFLPSLIRFIKME